MKTSLTCWSGVGEVTGANFLLTSGDAHILIDCGLIQGQEFSETKNAEPFPYNPSEIAVLVVTHAHLDHIGRIPKLVRDGFRGVIWSTPATRELAAVMFEDALAIFSSELRSRGKVPLYDEGDVKETLSLWKSLSYREETSLPGGWVFHFRNSGHILGSAMAVFSKNGKKIAFSGDLGNAPSQLLKNPESVEDVDYLLIESVYGDRNHEPKEERDRRFVEEVQGTLKRGGALVIPAFSIERTQNILYSLNNLVENRKIDPVPVFVDSPLATRVTDIYRRHAEDFNGFVKEALQHGDDIFGFPMLSFTASREESEAIHRAPNPKIILAGSGMSMGGRVTLHERRYLPDPNSTILLVGYQAVGTVGRRIEEGAKEVSINGEKVLVRARVASIKGFSSHMDSSHLVEFVAGAKKVSKVFVAMGEPKASLFLAQRLHDHIGVDALYPERGREYPLEF